MVQVAVIFRKNIRQFFGVAVVTLVTFVGALWYWLVEGFSLVNAIFQSVMAVSTVGFGETEPLDTSGRIFTIVLIVVGVASVVYALGGFAELVIESSLKRFSFRRKERTLEKMHGHAIICGYGRTGAAVRQLLPSGQKFGVIEADPLRADAATEGGAVTIEGDCTLDETLLEAGIERADRLIICLPSDSDAISTVLSARLLNSEIRIVARVNDAGSAHKLRLAGADQVVSPIEMGAQRLVADALEPSVGSFLDAALHNESFGLSIRGFGVRIASPTTIGELEAETGARIVGMKNSDGSMLEGPESSDQVAPGQILIAVGHRQELARLERQLVNE